MLLPVDRYCLPEREASSSHHLAMYKSGLIFRLVQRCRSQKLHLQIVVMSVFWQYICFPIYSVRRSEDCAIVADCEKNAISKRYAGQQLTRNQGFNIRDSPVYFIGRCEDSATFPDCHKGIISISYCAKSVALWQRISPVQRLERFIDSIWDEVLVERV
jgi:hypothetical protein